LVDARLLRLPHGRRGRSGHGLAAPRPSRVSFDRSSRDGDGQTIGSRLVNGGTVRRRAPLAVTPGRLNRSPIRVSKTRRLARGTRQWRLGAGDGSGAQTATNVRRETPFLGTPRKKFRSARPRARPLMSDRARASSPVARRAHDAASAALTLCISAYVLWVLAVRLPLVRRASAGFPRSRSALSFFAGGGNESSSRTRGSRPCAHAVSLRESRAPPVTHKRSSLRHAHARSKHKRSRETASRHY
jgi:hypothetical protein